ncbi:hypothetical protein QCN29_27015 [Streptomyces sp. HNM0663]|uniref:Uncharacterized protein n=1 Tax=Streptomyces chengmaiensis TaxID=3040919 RepID=A0ABT6HUG0_9ACTN|nr:hypothetical protein [Streptomyces chengmaiensis]MDH2392363.1 hypothetical protein [Streptomyces chengmaiensis]
MAERPHPEPRQLWRTPPDARAAGPAVEQLPDLLAAAELPAPGPPAMAQERYGL